MDMKGIKLTAFAIIAILLNSCLNYNQITTLKTDNSGKMFIHYWVEMDPDLDSLLINKIGLFNKESLTQNFSSSFTSIIYTNIFNDFTDSTLHAQIEFEFTNFDSLNFLNFFKHSELSIIDGPDDTKIFSQFIQPITTTFGLSEKNYSIIYTYYLPGNIIRHNANSLYRNKLEWNFTADEVGSGKTISATYIPFKLKETPIWIYILASLVILIVLVFLLKKSKK
ncbi:MAG: hypothetical protein IPM32_09810 [Ignavibacteriae bacterium]|nr:hypothetical protein [Ignavibacteriota bacterium]